ncbi:hypothetical protein [Aestuariivivens sediminis]|uniref:hypothetical protein n=1 Tax=Aestuariivivens sediminis TaxID=2913557 RepID=UPI001F596D86|nr:hypothetical protein [Aestuariivivens sediminis]
MSNFHFGHIVLFVLILFFGILFPLLFLGYRFGLGKRSKTSQNKGCWLAVFVITLIVTLVVLVGIALVVLLGAALTGNLS